MKKMMMVVNNKVMATSNGNLSMEVQETWEAIQDFGYVTMVMVTNILSLLFLVFCKVVRKAKRVWVPTAEEFAKEVFIKASGALATMVCALVVGFQVANKGMRVLVSYIEKGFDVTIKYVSVGIDVVTEIWMKIISEYQILFNFRKVLIAETKVVDEF